MKAKCIFPFFDYEAKCDREVGDVWECSKERFEAMNATAFGILVEEVKEKKAPKKPAKKADKE